MTLLLASTSPYRRELLGRLGLPFAVVPPEVLEEPNSGEAPAELAQRLALAKAMAVARNFPDATVIGSDQVPELDQRPLSKPGTRERARAQLQALAGRAVTFWTGLAVVHRGVLLGAALDRTQCRLRPLTAAEIERYLEREPAFDCAGAFKVEGLGISLFESIDGTDPTALQGLPLIALADLLRRAGHPCP